MHSFLYTNIYEYHNDNRPYIEDNKGYLSIRLISLIQSFSCHLYFNDDDIDCWFNIPFFEFAAHWYSKVKRHNEISDKLVKINEDDTYLISNLHNDYNNVDISLALNNDDMKIYITKYPECETKIYIVDITVDIYSKINEFLENRYRGMMTVDMFRNYYNKEVV